MAGKLMMVLLAAVMLSGGDARHPRRCCMPKQWTGTVYESVGVGPSTPGTEGKFISIAMNTTFDYTTGRMAIMEYLTDETSQVTHAFHVIADYSTNKSYIIDLLAKTCAYQPLTDPMNPQCLPHTAQYVLSLTMGSRARGLKVDSWVIPVHTSQAEVMYSVSFDKTCYPIGGIVVGKVNKFNIFASIGFSDITPNIRDPSVFTIPAICQKYDSTVLQKARTHSSSYRSLLIGV